MNDNNNSKPAAALDFETDIHEPTEEDFHLWTGGVLCIGPDAKCITPEDLKEGKFPW